jgi:hypothetical protein
MSTPRYVGVPQAEAIYSALQRHHFVTRTDIPEGKALGQLVERKKNELITLLTSRMPYPEKGQPYAHIRDAFEFPKRIVAWIYYPALNEDGSLPEYGFARIAPRAIIINARVKDQHNAARKRIDAKANGKTDRATKEIESRIGVFYTDRLITKLIEEEGDLISTMAEAGEHSILCNCEFWHYDKEHQIYYISSQAILGVEMPATMSPLPIASWEAGTFRFWKSKRGDGDISGLIHEPREELHVSPENFYEMASCCPIISEINRETS